MIKRHWTYSPQNRGLSAPRKHKAQAFLAGGGQIESQQFLHPNFPDVIGSLLPSWLLGRMELLVGPRLCKLQQGPVSGETEAPGGSLRPSLPPAPLHPTPKWEL